MIGCTKRTPRHAVERRSRWSSKPGTRLEVQLEPRKRYSSRQPYLYYLYAHRGPYRAGSAQRGIKYKFLTRNFIHTLSIPAYFAVRRSGSGRGPGRVRRWARGRRLTSDKATRRLVVCSRYRYRSLLVGPAPGLAPGSSCWHGRASASPSRCRGVVGFVCVTFTCSANIDNPNPPESPTPAALRRGLSTLPRQSV